MTDNPTPLPPPADDIAQLVRYALDSIRPDDCWTLDRVVPLTSRITAWLRSLNEPVS